jgi:polysaccharide pyruvyl transferase WcaK-like protein
LAYQSRRAEIGNHLGLNVRRAGYAGVGEEDSSPLRQALQKVIQDLGAPIQIAPISRAEGEDDWEQTLQLLPLESRRDLADLKQWQDVIPCVGRCRLMITGSYHAAVFALSQGIGAIGLVKSAYYRDKFRGLAHQFGPGCQLVDMETTDFPQRLATLARSLWDAAESNRGPLLAKAQEQIAQSRAAHQLMIRTIEKAA